MTPVDSGDSPDETVGPETLEDILTALGMLADRAVHLDDWPKALRRVAQRVDEAMQRTASTEDATGPVGFEHDLDGW